MIFSADGYNVGGPCCDCLYLLLLAAYMWFCRSPAPHWENTFCSKNTFYRVVLSVSRHTVRCVQDGETALTRASRYGYAKVVVQLLEKKADVNARNEVWGMGMVFGMGYAEGGSLVWGTRRVFWCMRRYRRLREGVWQSHAHVCMDCAFPCVLYLRVVERERECVCVELAVSACARATCTHV